MVDLPKPYKMINDFVTGKEIAEVGSEANRQAVERFLVLEKGYDREDIEVDVDIEFDVAGETYRSQIDLIVSVGSKNIRCMAIKCAAGSLGSCEREILAAARILDRYQIPLSVVSDGKTAIVMDTVSGKKIGDNFDAIPTRTEALEHLKDTSLLPCPEKRVER